MKNKTELAVGAMTLLGIIAFILGYKFLKGDDVFSRSQYIICVADQTNNLLPSNAVLENGVKIGRVSEIKLSNSPKYLNKAVFILKLDKDIKIPIDSKFKIYGLDMLGQMGMALLRGTSTTYAGENDTLPCIAGGNSIDEAVNLVSDIKPRLDSLMNSVTGLVNNLNTSLGSGENNLLARAMTDLTTTLNSVNKLSNNINDILVNEKSNLNGILTNANKLTKDFAKQTGKIDSILANFNTLSGKLNQVDLEGTVGAAKKTLEDLQATLKKVNEGDGSIAKLLNEDGAYNDIMKTIGTLDDLLKDLKANPKKYINLAIFDKSKNITVDRPADSIAIMNGKKVKIIDNKD